MAESILSSDFTIPVTVSNIGTEKGDPNSLNPLNVYINGNDYGIARWVGALEIGESSQEIFQIHVPEGPDNSCNYVIEVELETNDSLRNNNDYSISMPVESYSCIEGDLDRIGNMEDEIFADIEDPIPNEDNNQETYNPVVEGQRFPHWRPNARRSK